VSLYDWLLFLHVLAAFAAVASVVVLSAILAATWRSAGVVDAGPFLRMSRLGSRLWDVGGMGTLIFGIWLAVYVEGYELWDGWILAALVLWRSPRPRACGWVRASAALSEPTPGTVSSGARSEASAPSSSTRSWRSRSQPF